MNEIYFALLERRNAPLSQKLHFMNILQRFCGDPRALVETYLNYDCDGGVDNMFQKLTEDLSISFRPRPVHGRMSIREGFKRLEAMKKYILEFQASLDDQPERKQAFKGSLESAEKLLKNIQQYNDQFRSLQ